MKKIYLLVFMSFLMVSTALSQRVPTNTNRERMVDNEESKPFWASFGLGNFFYSGSFSVSGTFAAGYQPMDKISIGLQSKLYFDIIGIPNAPDISVFSYGGGPELRVYTSPMFYLVGQYSLMSIESANFNSATERNFENFFSGGIGYFNARGKVGYGVQVTYLFSDTARDAFGGRFLDYWVMFHYTL